MIQFEVVDTQEGNGERGWKEVCVVDTHDSIRSGRHVGGKW